jgi:hypothetical protein
MIFKDNFYCVIGKAENFGMVRENLVGWWG